MAEDKDTEGLGKAIEELKRSAGKGASGRKSIENEINENQEKIRIQGEKLSSDNDLILTNMSSMESQMRAIMKSNEQLKNDLFEMSRVINKIEGAGDEDEPDDKPPEPEKKKEAASFLEFLIGAIALAGGLLYLFRDSLGDLATAFWDRVKALPGLIKENATLIWHSILAMVRTSTIARDVWTMILNFGGGLSELAALAWNSIMGLGPKIVNFVKMVWSKIGDLTGPVLGFVEMVWSKIGDLAGPVLGFVEMVWSKIAALAGPVLGFVKMIWSKIAAITGPVLGFVEMVWDQIKTFGDGIVTVTGMIWDQIKTFGGGVVTLVGMIWGQIKSFGGGVVTLVGMIWDQIKTFGGGVVTLVGMVWGQIKTFGDGVVTVAGMIWDVVKKATGPIMAVGKFIMDAFKLAWKVGSVAFDLVGSIGKIILKTINLPLTIANAVKDLVIGMFKAGGKIIGKIGKAIMSSIGALGKVVSTVFKSFIKKLPLIGFLASIGFAVMKIKDGDYIGAGLELLSGIASLIPGFGTLASVGTDALIIARERGAFDRTPAEKKEDAAGGILSKIKGYIFSALELPVKTEIDEKLLEESGTEGAAQGAIATRTTQAIVGESGPEAIIPLGDADFSDISSGTPNEQGFIQGIDPVAAAAKILMANSDSIEASKIKAMSDIPQIIPIPIPVGGGDSGKGAQPVNTQPVVLQSGNSSYVNLSWAITSALGV